MSASEVVSHEAARQLRVNGSRVRQLAAAGALPGRKVANRWLFDAGAVQRRRVQSPASGRPYEPRTAWGVLFLASHEPASWLRPDERSRLRRRIREGLLDHDCGRLAKRGLARYLVAGERARAALERDPRFVRSGVSAAAEQGASLRSPGVLEGYLPQVDVERFAYRFALQSADELSADLILRSVAGFWPLDGRRVAPAAAVAVDLLESLDQRTRRAGGELLRKIER
ncbi:MAG: hypothetical protein HY553_20430 [Elusimicrobia bacterium]|nr:hypothetical protein [Elusimicrobiota bacterium]